MNLIFLVTTAFLIGSIPVGLIVSRIKGIDIRKIGSGNIGATNVMRNVGKKEALITLLGDMVKGIIPVVIALQFYPDNTGVVGIVGLGAIAGHDFSVFLKFRGGKGVATSLGVLLAYTPVIAFITLVIWIAVFAIARISSLSAIIAFLFLPLNTFLFDSSRIRLFVSLSITILILVKHKENIRRLLKGEELQIGQKA